MKTAGKVITGFVLGVALTAGAVVVADHGGRYWSHGEHGEYFAEFIVGKAERKLDLNAEQSAKLTEVVDQLMTLRDDFRQQREADRQQVLDLIAADTLDQRQVLEMVSEKIQFVNSNAPQAVATLAEFADSLDASQKQELVEMLEWKMNGRHHH